MEPSNLSKDASFQNRVNTAQPWLKLIQISLVKLKVGPGFIPWHMRYYNCKQWFLFSITIGVFIVFLYTFYHSSHLAFKQQILQHIFHWGLYTGSPYVALSNHPGFLWFNSVQQVKVICWHGTSLIIKAGWKLCLKTKKKK